VTKHLQQGIESDHFRVKRNMPKFGGFRSFNSARKSIAGFEAMLWLKKGFIPKSVQREREPNSGMWDQNRSITADPVAVFLKAKTLRSTGAWPISRQVKRPC
jgi:transposase-like protein